LFLLFGETSFDISLTGHLHSHENVPQAGSVTSAVVKVR